MTRSTDLVIKPVVKDMISGAITKELRFLPLMEVDNTTLNGVQANSWEVFKYHYIGKAQKYGEGEALTPRKLTTEGFQKKIEKAGTAVELTDETLLYAIENPESEAMIQLKDSVVDAIDADGFNSLQTETVLVYDAKDRVANGKDILKAKAKMGEKGKGKGFILISPNQTADIVYDPAFIKASDLGQKVLFEGAVGMISGLEVVETDEIVANEDGTYTNFIVQPKALKLMKKTDAIFKREEDTLSDLHFLSIRQHYLVYLQDENKAVKVTFKDADATA